MIVLPSAEETVSFIRPHKAVTIVRWLKTVLQQAGVDIAILISYRYVRNSVTGQY